MAKEAICALLAIFEHFLRLFLSIDLFFALAEQCGTGNGPVVYARPILAPWPHAAVAAAQVVM